MMEQDREALDAQIRELGLKLLGSEPLELHRDPKDVDAVRLSCLRLALELGGAGGDIVRQAAEFAAFVLEGKGQSA